MNKVIVSIYTHPEFYPPTLNAINSLAEVSEEVIVLTRNVFKGDFPFRKNVRLVTTGRFVQANETEHKSAVWKLWSFINFSMKKFQLIRKEKPALVIVYDPVPLLALFILKPFVSTRFKIWYHNHDIFDVDRFGKFTISWFAAKYENRALKQCDIFSLPANERKAHYQISWEKLKYFFLPNYPSYKFYSAFYKEREPIDEVVLIYQGSIGSGHGLEEIIPLLNERVQGKRLRLYLKGPIALGYKEKLIELAEKAGTISQLSFFDVTSYRKVPELASTAHIGIAIHTGEDIMNKTLGTASNKIYEYAALGLPVLLHDNQHFRSHLGKYAWAFFTDTSSESLLQSINTIVASYKEYADLARNDFLAGLNFEKYFQKAIEFITEPKLETALVKITSK